MKGSNRSWLILIGSLIAFSCSGCALSTAQIKAVEQFAQATEAAGTSGLEELPRMREMLVDMNVSRLQLSEMLGVPPMNADGTLIDYADLDESFDFEALEARVRALEALRQYARLLGSLVGDDSSKQIQSAAESLAARIDGLGSEFRAISDEQKTALAAAFQATSNWYTGWKKARITRAAVSNYQDQVNTIASLLTADFDHDGGNRLAQRTVGVYSQTVLLAQDAIRCGAEATRNGQDCRNRVESSRFGYEAFAEATANRQRLVHLDARLASSLQQVAAAHQNLNQLLEDDEIEIGQLEAFAQSVESVIDAGRALSSSSSEGR